MLLRKIILLIPLIYIFPIFISEEDKVFGVILAEPVSDIISAVVTGIMFAYTLKRLVTDKIPTEAEVNTKES